MVGFHQSFDFRIWRIFLTFAAICCSLILLSICWTFWKLRCSCNKTRQSRVSSNPSNRSSTDVTVKRSSSMTPSSSSATSGASSSHRIKWQIKALGILSLLFFLLADIASHVYVSLVKLPPRYSGPVNASTLSIWSIFNSCWSFAYGFTYLLFFERLRRSFVGSAHQLSVCTIVAGSLLIAIYIVLNQMISVCWWTYAIGTWTWTQMNRWYQPLLWTKFCVDWIFNAFLVYLFCSKIYKITLQKEKEDRLYFRNKKSFKLFEVMIKYFLLTFCTVLSTQIYTISEIILSQAISHAVETETYAFYFRAYAAYFLLGCMDSMVSTVYIMLTFPFGKKWYDKACGCCHRGCIRLWTSVASIDPNDENMPQYCAHGTPTGEGIKGAGATNHAYVNI